MLGIDPAAWFPHTDGAPRDSRVAGVATRRVAGRLDVSAALEQLAPLLARPEVRARLGGRLPALGPLELRAIDPLVSDPRVVLEAGRDDGKLRRLADASGRGRRSGTGSCSQRSSSASSYASRLPSQLAVRRPSEGSVTLRK